MSQIKRVEEYAKKLWIYLEDPIDGEGLLQVVNDIGNELMSNISEDNIDTICSILFTRDEPVHALFNKCGRFKTGDAASAVSSMLDILCTFLKKRKRNDSLQKYAKNLAIQCQNIAKNGSAKAQATAIEALIVMLDVRNGYDVNEFNVSNIYKTFCDQYTLRKGGAAVKIIELLGTIARFCPEIVDENQIKRLKRWCLDLLDQQLSSKAKPESAAITGYLTCLNSILYRNDNVIQPQSNESNKLFNDIIKVLYGFKDANRFAAPIAAMMLFKEHSELFYNLILSNCEKLYEGLHYWASHHNPNTYKYGLAAYEEFLRQLSIVLYHNIGGNREKAVFVAFMQKFNETLETADNLDNIYHVSVAIRSVGYFSKICSKLLDRAEVDELRNSLVKISDWFYSDVNTNQKEYIRHLPAFIKSYTSFAEELDTIPIELMETIHQMCNIFIMSFAEMSGYHRRNGSFYIHQLFGMLYKKGEGVFRNFVNSFFEKALICTSTMIKSPNEDRPAYTELLYFWKVILGTSNNEQKPAKKEEEKDLVDTEDIEAEDIYQQYQEAHTVDPESLAEALYDSFLTNFMKLIKALNLKVKSIGEKTEEEEHLNTLSKLLQPVNQKDFVLFQNLVEFWCSVLKEIDNTRLAHWVYILSSTMIDLSIINPLVSGFYRILAEILIICETNRFFLGCKTFHSQSNQGSEANISQPTEYVTYLVVLDYLKVVWHRLQQFTDELLASCLRLILAYPVEFFDITELITPLEKALRLGITYHPLATIAMNSLDKLMDPDLNYDIDSYFLSRILPCINEYLLVGVVSFGEEEGQHGKKKSYKTPTASQRRYQSVRIKMTSDQLGVIKRNYADLPELQKRMMRFLGRLGGKNKQLLLEGKSSIQDNGMLAWDPERKLKLRVPFMNVKVDIYLDEYLPRICELAESSPDRKVKVAACELLHGLVIYMIGNSAFQAKTTQKATESLYHKFYLRVFPVMLRLAIDPDQIAREMYQLLYSQIIHWLTNNAHAENPETIELLQTFLDAACSTDAGLRDYGAECIQEFVKWSIKQTTRSTDATHNIKSLITRLYNLMVNPSASKRFGASLIFNHIYRLFREEASLVNLYTFEILGQLLVSLKIAEADHPSIGTQGQIIEAINHIKRIIREKSNIFLTENDRHSFIGEVTVRNLYQLVQWTFEESGSFQRTYAKVCMTLFTEFAILLPDIKSCSHWLSKELCLNPLSLVNIFETEQLQTPSLVDDESHAISKYLSWIKRLNATIDGYIWLIEREVIDPLELLQLPSSMFLVSLSFFIRNTPYDYLEEKLDQSPVEKNKIMSIYTHNAMRLIYFLDLVIRSPKNGNRSFQYLERIFADTLYHNNLTDMISTALIMPKQTSETIEAYHGNAITQSSVARILDISRNFITTMLERSSPKFMDSLALSISKVLKYKKVNMLFIEGVDIERSLLIEISQTLDGIEFLQSIGALDFVCQKSSLLYDKYPNSAFKYCEQLFSLYLKNCKSTQEPLYLQLTGRSIVICFSQKGFAKQYAAQLLGFQGPLKKLSNSQKIEIFQKYIEYVSNCIASHFEVFSLVLSEQIADPISRDYLILLLEYLKANKISQRKLVWSLTNELVKEPIFLKTIVAHWQTEDQLLDLILCLKLLFGADPGIMSRSKGKPIFDLVWNIFMGLLDDDHPFKVKNSALDLLPVFICIDEDHAKQITKKLQRSYVQHFPPDTSELQKGTTKQVSIIINDYKMFKLTPVISYNNYISILDKLMGVMTMFKSVPMFKLLKVTFVQEKQHVHDETIKKNLADFSKGLGLKSFLEITQDCFELFKDENYSILHRTNLVELIITFLASAGEGHVHAFYEKNLCDILSVIQKDLDEAKDFTLECHIKANCLRLIQAFYELLERGLVDKDGALDKLWQGSSKNYHKPNQNKRNSIQSVIIDVLVTMRKSGSVSDEGLSIDRREAVILYNQAVFNAAVALVLRVSDKVPFYNNLFGVQSGMYVWDQIVDMTEPLNLKLELDQPLMKTKLEDLRAISGQKVDRKDQSITYMASVALSGSSLTQPSLSDMVLEERGKKNEESAHAIITDEDIVMTEAIDEPEEFEVNDEDQVYEIDVLNQHSFMRSLTEVIQRLHKKICPPTKDNSDMPQWMINLNAAFRNAKSIIIQVYIVKLITNYPFAFESYAKHWVLPLTEFITKGSQFGMPINYLIQDLCIVLIVWGRFTEIPDARSYSCKRILFNTMEYLIENAYHESPRVMRSNIQIIKGLFENWGTFCPVPTRTIYEKFHHSKEERDKNIVGLQVAGIIFSNGVNVYDQNEFSNVYDLSESTFYTDMGYNINYRGRKNVDIATDAAELMSWALKFMKEKGSPIEKQLRERYIDMIKELGNAKDYSANQFLKCMNRVYLHDLELGQELLAAVTQRLNHYSSAEKVLALTFINACWKDDETVYYTLKVNGITRMLTSRDEKLQIVALKVFNTLFSIMDADDLKSNIKKLLKIFTDHPNSECRSLYYAFLKKCYHSRLVSSLQQVIKARLLRGLIDQNDHIASDIFDFLKTALEIDDDIRSTLLKITRAMYIRDTEDVYLLYATRVILNNTKKTYDFSQPIFERSLPNARFDANYQKINTSWHSTSSMMPLFSNSQAKSLDIEDLELQLRQTQSLLEFSTTQATGKSLVSTFNPAGHEESIDDERLDDATVEEQANDIKKKLVIRESPYFTRRFFTESKGVISRFHADRNESLQKKLRNLLNSKKEAGEKKVVLSRLYRVGEIPDVQIKNKDLLMPLEILATADYNISRLLYSSLVVSIVNELKESATEEEHTAYMQKMVTSISENLAASKMFFTPTTGSFLRIIFDLDAPISASLVKIVSSKSHNHHIGIAILEKQLAFGDGTERPKKKTNNLTPTKEKWIYLSLLYQSIDELEIFENLYLTNVATNDLAKDGVRNQIKGDYALAFNSFNEAVSQPMTEKEVSVSEYNLWQEQMLYCRKQLGQWGLIARDTTNSIDNNLDRLWADKEDPYLEYFIRSYSKFKKMLFLNNPNDESSKKWTLEDPNPIYRFLDEAYENEAHKEKILDNFACDWSIVEIFRKNYSRSRIFIAKSYESLLSAWTTLHPLARTSRLSRLAQLQRIVELEDYLKVHKSLEDGNNSADKILSFMKSLISRYPDTRNDRMDVWYDILQTRFEFIDDLTEENMESIQNISQIFQTARNEFVSATIDAAIDQSNLTALSNLLLLYNGPDATLKANIGRIRYVQHQAEHRPPEEKTTFITRTIARSLALKLPENTSPMERYDWKILLSKSFSITKNQLIAYPTLFDAALNDEKRDFQKSARRYKFEQHIQSADAYINYLEKLGYETLDEAKNYITDDGIQRSNYLWRFGSYCDDSLHTLQDACSTLQPDFDPIQYTKVVIECYFEAINRDYKDASNFYPRLLELIELYPETGPTFNEHSLKVDAAWKFIKWIPQLVSLMSTPIAEYIFPTLERIAQSYPRALYYPFQMSCEFYELRKDKLSAESRRSIEKIMHLIRSPIMEKFSDELRRLSNPEHIVKDFLDYIKSIILNQDVPQSFVESRFKEFYHLLLNNYTTDMGLLPKQVAKEYANKFLKYMGENGSKITKITPKQMEELARLCDHLRDITDRFQGKNNLKTYSNWLSKFKSTQYDEELEIPGQYDGLSKPCPELHAKVSTIDPKISVMSSLRKPKRICIYGTDEREHHFLVKGGEDLRLDERIQQLFRVMNDVVKKNGLCSSQNIQVGTYKVIPMASNLGIIEWLVHTQPLKSCVDSNEDAKPYAYRAREEYARWIRSNMPRAKNQAAQYHKAFSQPRETIVSTFKKVTSYIPSTIIRDFLFKLASSPEAFLFLRKDFAYSLACISIFGYILGIGDRHLENFLIDKRSGRLIPIDFGYAFGTSSELTAIPEVVPFRLTGLLISVLEPLGVSGILEDSMTNLLMAVQAEKELLLNIMSVFVREPLLEWKKAAERENKIQRRKVDGSSGDQTESLEDNIQWYPQRKIAIAKRKLNRGNPANIVVTEIQNGHGSRPFFNDIAVIARGDPSVDIRATVGDTCQDANEQVKCLINLATDPRVLGVMWAGWQPFL